MYNSRSIVLLDFDEFPTPHRYETWNELFTKVSATDSSCSVVESFRNAFFPVQKLNQHPSGFDLQTLKHTRRGGSFKCGRRSKLIVDPRAIAECSVHVVVHVMKPHLRECCLPDELALLHHYRTRPSVELKMLNIDDRRMWHFDKKIIKSTKKIYDIMHIKVPKFSNRTS
jgi:hypothetical protein